MADESYISSDSGILSIYDTSAYEPVACLTSWELSESVEEKEVVTMCNSGNVVKTAGPYSYQASGEGIEIDSAVDTGKQSHAELAALMRAKTVITWRRATGITSPTTEYGTGIITALSKNHEAGENATFSFTISGRGTITSTDPNAT